MHDWQLRQLKRILKCFACSDLRIDRPATVFVVDIEDPVQLIRLRAEAMLVKSSWRKVEKSSTWAWEHWRPSRTRRSPSSRCCRRRRLWREHSTWSQRMSNRWRERLPCPRRSPPPRSGRRTRLWVRLVLYNMLAQAIAAMGILGELGLLNRYFICVWLILLELKLWSADLDEL